MKNYLVTDKILRQGETARPGPLSDECSEAPGNWDLSNLSRAELEMLEIGEVAGRWRGGKEADFGADPFAFL